MSLGLVARRHFAPLFWSQTLGAFHDTFLRGFAVALLGAAGLASTEGRGELALAATLALFIVPFLLCSAWGGSLADRLDKQRLIRRLKLFEVAIALVAALAIWLDSVSLLYLALLASGAQWALFTPAKYAILPQHLAPTELLKGNAWIVLGTFAALAGGILLVALVAGLASPWERGTAGLLLIGVASLGVTASLGIPPAPPRPHGRASPPDERSFLAVLPQSLGDRRLLATMLGIGAFWFLGTGYLFQMPVWTYGLSEGESAIVGSMLVSLALGGGAGAMLCARLSAGRLELGLVTFGALLVGLSGLALASISPPTGEFEPIVAQWAWWSTLALLGVAGIGAGLYAVPLYTYLQIASAEERRGRVLAVSSILSSLCMGAALLFAIVMLDESDTGRTRFVAALGTIALLIGLGFFLARPRPVLRLLVFTLVHVIYRLRFRGRHHIPARGAALVVCNHVSFMDALVIGGASPRPLRFLMDRPIYESPWLNWWFRIVGAIPVDSDRRDPGSVRRALDEVSRALRQGEVVMLFPEGRLTPDGEVHPFRRGLEIILARDPVPVVPAGLAGLWGSWTSHKEGRALTKWPRRFRARVALYFGEPLPAVQARRGALEARVRELKAEAGRWAAS